MTIYKIFMALFIFPVSMSRAVARGFYVYQYTRVSQHYERKVSLMIALQKELELLTGCQESLKKGIVLTRSPSLMEQEKKLVKIIERQQNKILMEGAQLSLLGERLERLSRKVN